MFTRIKGYERYGVSTNGIVFDFGKNRVLKINRASLSYLNVSLYTGKARKNFSIHRLVAQTYIPNPNNLPEVNHIDRNKQNNDKINLEWCTHLDNIRHAHHTGYIINPGAKVGRRLGTKLSEQTKKQMSDKKIGDKHPKYKGDIVTPLGSFGSSYAAAKAHDTSHRTIQYRCKSNNFKDFFVNVEANA